MKRKDGNRLPKEFRKEIRKVITYTSKQNE